MSRRSRRPNPWEHDGRNVRARFHDAPAEQDQEQEQFNIVTLYQNNLLDVVEGLFQDRGGSCAKAYSSSFPSVLFRSWPKAVFCSGDFHSVVH